MHYINYYAKPRITTTEEEMIKEYERTRGLIYTKHFDASEEIDYERLVNHLHKGDGWKVLLNNIAHIMNMCRRDTHHTTQTIRQATDTYQSFRIPKQSGGYRTINAPTPALKEVQQRLLKFLIKDLRVLPHNAAHGCVKNRNCLTSLKVHQRNQSKYFLKLDLHDAFGSVNIELLKEALKKHVLLGKLESQVSTVSRMVNICTNEHIPGLPQGAPTSPMLLNMYLQAFDEAISKTLAGTGIVYTRYVDDMLFSSKQPIDVETLIALVKSELPEGMTIKDTKTRYGNYNWKNWNLGIMYNNEGKLTVGYKNKKLIKNRVHNYNTRVELQTRENYMQLNGLISYYRYIEPDYFDNERFALVDPRTLEVIDLL